MASGQTTQSMGFCIDAVKQSGFPAGAGCNLHPHHWVLFLPAVTANFPQVIELHFELTSALCVCEWSTLAIYHATAHRDDEAFYFFPVDYEVVDNQDDGE